MHMMSTMGHWWKRVILFLMSTAMVYSVDYSVHFIGLDDAAALKSVKAASSLTLLQNKSPPSLNALRFRAESDTPEMIKALHNRGYYDASIQIRIEEEGGDAQIFVMIQPGAVYLVQEIQVDVFSEGKKLLCAASNPEALGLNLGKPAITAEILDAQQRALAILGECGYPLAVLKKQELTADYQTKTFSILFEIEAGPLAKFGTTLISGNQQTHREFFDNKISWKEGEIYDTKLVEQTQKKLLDTGLFTSAVITHAPEVRTNQELLMHIDVVETKHRSINFGASYQTFFGPGLTFGWENRNTMGMGRRLSLQGDVTAHSHTGTATFFVPDCWKVDQDFVSQAQAMQESILAYHELDYSVTGRVERRVGTKYRVSAGLRLERMIVGKSVQNGTFSLAEAPLYFRWSSANNLLNPTSGATLELKVIPSFNFGRAERFYLYNAVNYAFYWGQENIVVAQQFLFSSILSTNLEAVPVPKRVLGGSDQEMRGYRYHSVSPLHHHKPIGGRSGIFYTFETRFRLSKTIGLVPFFDLGAVYLTPFPTWHEKWYKSAGLGLRYFTFLGPLRFDIAFPLDRRKEIDQLYRILVSIGQAF
jgi:translocation and assembly module TamA